MKTTVYHIHDSKTGQKLAELYAMPSEAKRIEALSAKTPEGHVTTNELGEIDCASRGLLEMLPKSIYLVAV